MDITAQLLSRAQAQPAARPPREVSFLEAFGKRGLGTFIDNLLSAPSLVPGIGTAGMSVGGPIADQLIKQGFGGLAGEGVMQAVGARQRPVLPTSNDIRAAGQVAKELFTPQAPQNAPQATQTLQGTLEAQAADQRALPGLIQSIPQRFSQAQQDQAAETAVIEQQAPFASGLGEFVGHGATLALGRAPLAKARAQQAPIQRAAARPGLRSLIDEWVRTNSNWLLGNAPIDIAKGVRLAGETALEGAVLARLNDQDPAAAAGLSAGAQLAASAALNLGQSMFKSPASLLTSVGMTTIGLELLKDVTPGSSFASLYQSANDAIFKVLPTAVASLFATSVGFGRAGKNMSKNIPKIADAIRAIPRGGMLGLINSLSREREQGGDTLQRSLSIFSEDPEGLGNTMMRRISRALNLTSQKAVERQLDKLKQDKELLRQLEEHENE